MRKIYLLSLFTCVCHFAYSQCTPAAVRGTSTINTPGYALNTAFNGSNTAVANVNNLSSGLINFTGTVNGTARWTGGVQIQNEPSIGNYVFVQPNLTTNPATPTNTGSYTVQFSEPVTNMSFRLGGLNNQDRIIITAFNGVTPITITAANFTDNVPDPGNAGTIVITGGNTLTGNNTAGGVSVITNRITLNIPGPVTRVVMVTGKANDNTGNVTLGFTTFAYTKCAVVPPDVNATFVNVAVTGNVGTNDVKPTGTTYGTATALPGNPGPAVPVINADGTYSFTSAVPGVFRYTVPMCPGSVVVPDCPNVELVITVTNPNVISNNPVANTDRAITSINTPVTLNTLANDKSGNNPSAVLNPASVTVTTAPLNGTTSINPATGAITYTPNPGYTGTDTLTYRVCDNSVPTPLCSEAKQIITVAPAGSSNSTLAADDYNSTAVNVAVNGNVISNDMDPEANTQTITAQNTTIPGRGTLQLNTNGTYTFTPVSGYTGPVNFPYEVCDNGTPQACTNATLYILINPFSTLPLTLLSFTGVLQNDNAEIKWLTESEENTDYFDLERSDNGFNFTAITRINAAGSGNNSYGYTDRSLRAGKNWYRLKMADKDGRFRYSTIIVLSKDDNGASSLYPNPVTDIATLKTASALRGTTARVVDVTGKAVMNIVIKNNFETVNLRQLSIGTYYLKLADGAVLKFVKQ
jgi:hypothetical protein